MSNTSTSYQYIFHGTRLNINPHYQKYFQELELTKDSDWQHYKNGEVISQGSTTCLKVKLPNSNQHIYFKRYLFKKNKWRFFLRKSKAATELTNYQHISNLGIPTVEVIALYEQRTLGRLSVACIITKEIPNTVQLDEFHQEILLKQSTEKQKIILKRICNNLFQQLKIAHNANFFHLDLKWRNVLIDLNDKTYTPIWIDCPRGKKTDLFTYKNKTADLSGLARKALSLFPPQQLYRMLRIYLGKNAKKSETKKLFLDIAKHIGRRPPKEN